MRTLQARFGEAATQATSREDLLARLARTLSEIVRADLLGLARENAQGELSIEGLLHPIAGLPEQTTRSLHDNAQSAMRERQTRMGRIGRPPNQLLICVPILTTPAPEVLLALFLAPVAAPDVLTTVVELAVSTLSLFDLRASTTTLDHEASATAALVDLAARVQSETNVTAAGQVLCDEVTRHLNVVQTAVGMSRPGGAQCRLIAVSRSEGNVSPERRDTLLEAALDECLLRGEPACWPPPPGTPRHSLVTHKQLALRWNAESVVSIPLRTHTGEVVGAWLAVVPSQQKSRDVIGFMQAATPLVAAALRSLQRGERGRIATLWNQLAQTLRKRRGRLLILASCMALGLLCVPMPYAVRGGCEVQPVSLRYIAAPFEARLLRAEVEPGDEIATGQLLARLDDEEIRWELSGATAEFDRAAKERDSHLAEKDFNAAQVARLEMARMDAKASVLRQRSDQLEIRSPVDGVVISGDLRKAEGAPLTTGQTLFEIAPLDEMVIEIGIPEDDITHVAVGQNVEAVLNALPDRSWVGQISRIHPRSELVDQDYVFVAEVRFQNDLGLLRPGMKGRAKITTDKHPLGWNLFHKAVDQVRFWTGW
ncbi:MAG: efflux RND transporter periplasmic adaptor subunit [Planctomycetaceae bacterium]